MKFELIDRQTWKRKAYFKHYFSDVPCTYSMSVKLDITEIIVRGMKLYPAMIYCLTSIVNRHKEFRTAIDDEMRLGIFDEMIPCYTVFNKGNECFSNIWTECTGGYESFLKEYEKDVFKYGECETFEGKPDAPQNCFPVSMIPWASFEGFNLNLQKGYTYLLPIFTMGKYYEENGRYIIPLAVQVHHAVCDGFHVCRFINELQEMINSGF